MARESRDNLFSWPIRWTLQFDSRYRLRLSSTKLLDAFVVESIGKDYAEVIKNDPELESVFNRLKKFGLKGSDEASRAIDEVLASRTEPAAGEARVDKDLLAKTAQRLRGQISDGANAGHELGVLPGFES